MARPEELRLLGEAPVFLSWTAWPVRLEDPPRRVVVPPLPRLTGTMEARLPDPPARCRKSASAVRPEPLREVAVGVPPSRILNPELPRSRWPSS